MNMDGAEPVSSRGLTAEEARRLLHEAGRNELVRTSGVRPLKILLSQFASPLIVVLIVAAAVSMAVGFLPGQDSNTVDAVLIMIIVLISGIFGFVQDFEAERTIEALQQLSAPLSRVVRDGRETEVPSAEVVPGDLLLLESGDMVTADGRLLKTFHLEVDESVLTGESQATRKEIGEEVFSNTYVTAGNARVVVQATGMHTRIGKVASRLQEMKEEKSSFERELTRLGKRMSALTLIIAAALAVIGVFKFGIYNSLLNAISLAVAAIPEGLPAVVVMALAVGANKMVKRNALIRKLSIVESIGAVDVICTDKTGTLTMNEMTVTRLHFDGKTRDMSDDESNGPPDGTGVLLLKCGMLCNNATVRKEDDGTESFLGGQTEIALMKAGSRVIPKSAIRDFIRVNEVSFTSERKMMSVVVEDGEKRQFAYSKGAPEWLLEKCDRIVMDGQVRPLGPELRDDLLTENARMAGDALRVLGFAYRPVDKDPMGEIEEGLIWIGLQGMIDPPREEVEQALRECRSAGIRVIMITGDNPATAEAIARQISLSTDGTVTGAELERMDNAELKRKLNGGVNVFARTTPFHKLRILECLDESGEVAMTGDGVNDALAIKKARVGVSMGRKGTEVAKQASDIVLLDDNFSTIKEAVREGRTIFNNIRKFINYLLTCNFAEVAVIFLSTLLFTLDEPVLFPAQLLWINLLTDGLVALALGVDPPAEDIMKKPPRKRNEPIINKQLGWLIGVIGIKKTIVLMATFFIVYQVEGIEKARSVLFAGFVLYEFVRIASIRYQEKLNWLSNKWLLYALFGSLLLQMIVIYTPLNRFFHVEPLNPQNWIVLLAGCVAGFALSLPITRAVMKYVPG